MINKILNSIAWSFAFALGTASIIGYFLSLIFGDIESAGGKHADNDALNNAVMIISIFVPTIAGALGLILAVFGKLPRIKLNQNKPVTDKEMEPLSEKQMRSIFIGLDVNLIVWLAVCVTIWSSATCEDYVKYAVTLGFIVSALIQHWVYDQLNKTNKSNHYYVLLSNDKIFPASIVVFLLACTID